MIEQRERSTSRGTLGPFQPVEDPPAAEVATAVHLWRVDLNPAPETLAALAEILSVEECQKLQSFQFEADRRRYLVSHAALRRILGRYLGLPPRHVCFWVNPSGKPALLPPAGLHFNLSHSQHTALVAVTGLGPVGVDVEYIRPLADLRGLAQSCFSAAEFCHWQELPPAQRLRAFFSAWTRKEAFIKGWGSGLSFPLDQFEVALRPGEQPLLKTITAHPEELPHWTLQDIWLGPAYAAAFALRACPADLRVRTFLER